MRSNCSSASATVMRRSSSFQGLRMNLYTAPSLIAPITASVLAWPVSMMRIVSGERCLTSRRNWAPFMPGIMKSLMTRCTSPSASRASPSGPLLAVTIS